MTDIIEEIAALTARIDATTHVGWSNRLMSGQSRLFRAVDARPDRLDLLRRLLKHDQPAVRMATTWHCGLGQIAIEDAERAVTALAERPDASGRDTKQWLESRQRMAAPPETEQPPQPLLRYEATPTGASRDDVEGVIASLAPEGRVEAILALLRPTIRVWPQARRDDPRASCFGGLPAVPRDFVWPRFEDAPLLFLGQINLAELHAAIGRSLFPKDGIIQFFGDHDDVNGCGPTGGSAVFYWPDVAALQPAAAPADDFLELPRCGLDFYSAGELPHPMSEVIAALRLSSVEQAKYRDLHRKVCAMAAPESSPERTSKLLGWSELIQRDLGSDFGRSDAGEDLLLQIGWRHDGRDWQHWGLAASSISSCTPTRSSRRASAKRRWRCSAPRKARAGRRHLELVIASDSEAIQTRANAPL